MEKLEIFEYHISYVKFYFIGFRVFNFNKIYNECDDVYLSKELKIPLFDFRQYLINNRGVMLIVDDKIQYGFQKIEEAEKAIEEIESYILMTKLVD